MCMCTVQCFGDYIIKYPPQFKLDDLVGGGWMVRSRVCGGCVGIAGWRGWLGGRVNGQWGVLPQCPTYELLDQLVQEKALAIE